MRLWWHAGTLDDALPLDRAPPCRLTRATRCGRRQPARSRRAWSSHNGSHGTSGTLGWGRKVARRVLQDRARAALVMADVVLLCFDSSNQEAAEFVQVAEWIAAYGKPVVAVVNSKNGMWRRPTHVGASRRSER